MTWLALWIIKRFTTDTMKADKWLPVVKIILIIVGLLLLLLIVGGFFTFCSSNNGSGGKNKQAGNIANYEKNIAVINHEINQANEEVENANKKSNEAESNFNTIKNQSLDNQSNDFDDYWKRFCERPNNRTRPECR